MTYFEWLARGPVGAEGATLMFDLCVGAMLFCIGSYLLVQAWRER